MVRALRGRVGALSKELRPIAIAKPAALYSGDRPCQSAVPLPRDRLVPVRSGIDVAANAFSSLAYAGSGDAEAAALSRASASAPLGTTRPLKNFPSTRPNSVRPDRR